MPINLSFWSTKGNSVTIALWCHNDVTSVEAPSGHETSPEEGDITLLLLRKKSKGFNILCRNNCNLKKKSMFLRHPV